MKYILVVAFGLFGSNPGWAQSNPPRDISIICSEGLKNSQVMEILSELSDIHGPRLTGSDGYLKAAQWTRGKLDEWEVDRAYFEPYCPDCRGWDPGSFNVEMIEPSFLHIIAYPMAWTRSSNGQETGEIIQIPDVGELANVKAEFEGKLRGKVVLMGVSKPTNLLFEPLNRRFSPLEPETASKEVNPIAENPIGFMAREPVDQQIATWTQGVLDEQALLKWLEEQGVIGVLVSSHLFPAIAHPSGTSLNLTSHIQPIPYFSIAPEHFGRLVRLVDRGLNPKVRFHLETDLYHRPENNVNVLAELTGTDNRLKSEVIMIGGHFDSWHAATGATDNGAGVAVMMEVIRILKETGVNLKRTVRLGLWGGEEQRFAGSMGYARSHFGELGGARRPEAQLISAYLNHDNGAGAIRGVYLQGNEEARPLFEDMLSPFDSLDANNITIQNADFTDHDIFDYYGIPAFQFIQDPLNYMSVTHHTTMDVLEYAPEEDLKKNAVIISWLVYQIANLEKRVPRK